MTATKIQDSSDNVGHGNYMEAVHHLGQAYPRGNCYKGKYISPEEAVKLKQNCDGGKLPALLYNKQMPGFDPDTWKHVVTKSSIGRKLFHQNPNGAAGQGHALPIHHCVSKALKQMHQTCEYIIENCGDVQSSNSWGGVGSMCPAGYHFHLGDMKQCAIKKGNVDKRRLMQSYLSNSGQIFTDQFAYRGVGYDKMLQDQHDVCIKGRKCPRTPACWVASKNLGNPEHTDSNDYSWSFAVWVMKASPNDDSAWLLFPQWGVAIQLCHGTYISWDGTSCAHSVWYQICQGGVAFFSLFTALLKMLINNLSLRHACKSELVNRINHKNLGEDESPCKTFLQSLKVGMMVRKRWVQPIPSLPNKLSIITPMKQDTILEAKTHTRMYKAKMFKRKECRRCKRDCKWALCPIELIDRDNQKMVLVVTGSMNWWKLDLTKSNVWNTLVVVPVKTKLNKEE
jgi:hypothetical protein